MSPFPRYTDYDPKVPVWCATPDIPRCIHRFFDTSPISPSGRYLAVFQLPFEDRAPEIGDIGRVHVIDLATGESRMVGETRGWEAQLGANINWGGTDEELYFNDVVMGEWQPFAWKVNPLSGEKQRLDGTVYHASPDGRWLVSANMLTMGRTQLGYGVPVPVDHVPLNIGPKTDDGFYLTDTQTGKRRLLVSIAALLEQADPGFTVDRPEETEFYGFHSKFNPQGDRLMLSLRWYKTADRPDSWTTQLKHNKVGFAWFTVPVEGNGPIHCAVGPDQWKKGGHHATWFPDGWRISMNLDIDRDGMRFVEAAADGTGLRKILPEATGSGHPSIHRDGKFLITDTYLKEPDAFGDGTVPLRWINLETAEEEKIVRIPTNQPCTDGWMRVDPHPAWDRSWRYVTFNAFLNGTRRVMIADMAGVL